MQEKKNKKEEECKYEMCVKVEMGRERKYRNERMNVYVIREKCRQYSFACEKKKEKRKKCEMRQMMFE